MSDTIVRPRLNDLGRAVQPHPFEPSGEIVGRLNAERCDLCGCLQRGTWLHPDAGSDIKRSHT